jgi:hypothetical protein
MKVLSALLHMNIDTRTTATRQTNAAPMARPYTALPAADTTQLKAKTNQSLERDEMKSGVCKIGPHQYAKGPKTLFWGLTTCACFRTTYDHLPTRHTATQCSSGSKCCERHENQNA